MRFVIQAKVCLDSHAISWRWKALELAGELEGAEFGDYRLIKIAEGFGNKPNLSIPAALDQRAEMEAAYRIFDNDKVSPQAILAPHVRAMIERVGRSETAILVQDTTELDLTRPAQQVEGSGPLEFESRRGLFHHPLLAFDGRGLCLGKLWEQNWAREKIERGGSASEKQQACRAKPIEEKESMRWLEGLRAARRVGRAARQSSERTGGFCRRP